MKVIAVNGSARKNWNTDILLQNALDGAKSKGADTELINLYDINFKGCIGCLGCKLKAGKPGRCVIKDELTPLLDKVAECDALFIGSPIYLNEVTGEMRSFLERLLFQYISYDKERVPLFDRKIKTAAFFTTNAPEPMYDKIGYTTLFSGYERMIGGILGECRTLASSETWQTNDFDKYHMSAFDVPARRRRREEVFPEDCKKAFEIGVWAVSASDR